MNERKERISWNEMFINIAKIVAQRSPDPHTQVGAVLVKDNRILSVGYNGCPNNFKYDFDWATPEKYTYCVHAEANALSNAAQVGANVKDASIFLTLSPCADCAKLLVQAGIKNIYYLEDYKDILTTRVIIDNVEGVNLIKINERKY